MPSSGGPVPRLLPFAAMLALLFAGALPNRADASGYGIYEQGSKALGMGGAFTARADDPTAVFFNPAGLAQLPGTQLNGGVHLILIQREFSGTPAYPGYGVEETSPNELGTPVNLYLSHRLSSTWGVGLGVYNPFGLKTAWEDPDRYTGRFINREAGITPFYVTPTLAANVTDWLSVGGGPSFITSTIELERNVGIVNPLYGDARFPGAAQLLDLGTANIDGSGTALGWTAGVQVRTADRLSFGAVYRSGVDVEYDGDADFTYDFQGSGNAALDQVLGPQLEAQFPADQGAGVTLPFPASAAFGLAFDPHDAWTVAMDVVWNGWSRLSTVGLNFDDEELSSRIEEDWHDSVAFRLGAEWRTSKSLALRGGWYYDETPQPTKSVDPLLPDSNRNGLTLGAGIGGGALHADVYTLLLLAADRSTRGESLRGYDGTYATGAVVFGLNLNYQF